MENNRIFNCSSELQINVPRVSHIKWRQVNTRIRNPERYHIVEQIVAFACERSQRVAPLFLIQGRSRVTKS